MYRSLSGHRPRPPSPSPQSHRRGQHSLSIRTTSQQPQQVMSQQSAQHGTSTTAPPQPPYPNYPLPIPIEKQQKARKLYHKYQMEETLDRIKHEPQSVTNYQNSFLSVPGPQSVTSRTSSRHNRATSISTSTYDAVTELSSVVSCEGDESPSVKAKGELLSFDGVSVKAPRIRRRLSSVKRAKAALVRHLGSCWVCHSRKVPCPLDHHDLQSLLQMTPIGNRTQSQSQFPQSPTTPSQKPSISSEERQQVHLSFSQTDALAGIQGNAGLDDLGPIAATLDIPLLGSYGDTQLPTLGMDLVAPALPTSPYQIYQNGDMFPLGFRNNSYYCQHLNDGFCNEVFDTDEELQQHFAISHFAFTRISPAHRFVCSECLQWNNDLNSPCYSCKARGSIQLWVYGHYIRTPDYPRHAPDGQDQQGFGTYPTDVSPVFFPDMAWNLGIDSFDSNADSDRFNMQDGNLYGGPGNQGYGYNPPSGSDTRGSQFQGSSYGGAQQFAMDIPDAIRLSLVKSRQFFINSKVTLLLLSLLAILTFGLSYQWILCKAEAQYRDVNSKLHAQIPVFGFMVILASFVLSLVLFCIMDKRMRRQNQCVIVVLNDLSRKLNQGTRDDALFILSRILLHHSSADHLRLILVSMSADTHGKHWAHLHESTFTPLMNHVL